MHYYQFNIGDYKSHTEHLSEMEDLAYRRLLDWYYLHESPIPQDITECARQIRMRSHTDCIATVLQEYFERTDNGWTHGRADKEIAKTGAKSEKAAESARKRWDKHANALPPHSECNATHNTLPITQNTKHKTQVNTANDGFAKFWETWPTSERKQAKGKCLEKWKSINAEIEAKSIIAHVEKMKHCDDWKKQNGAFILAPLTYLNQRRWEGASLNTPTDSFFAGGF